MTVQLNHTIVWCRDQEKSSKFLTDLLGLPAASRFMHFLVVTLENGVSLDYYEVDREIALQHYAFLIDEERFDQVLGRIRAQGLPHWADPAREKPDQINHHDGGRGVYFQDPDGHLLEVITRPYGSGG